MVSKHYTNKVVIIGAGLGGLSAAIRLRVQGMDVSVYEANARPGGRANIIERNGFRFDTGPSLLNYPWVFEELFRFAGRNFYDFVELLPVDPSITFHWTNGVRLALSSDIHHLLQECERLEPDVAPALLRFFLDASRRYRVAFDHLVQRNADSFAQWFRGVGVRKILSLGITRSLHRDLRRYFRSRYICEALGSYSMYLGGSPFDLPGIFSILPYGELAYGLSLPKGGIYGLVKAMERLALDLGVRIFLNSPVRRIRINNRKVVGIELENDTFIESSLVISNVDVPTTYSRLIASESSALPKAPKVRMTPSVVTFYWGVKGTIHHLPHHAIFLPNDYKKAFDQLMNLGTIPDELPLYTSMPSATDPSLAPEGHSLLFVLIPVPVLSKLGPIDWNTLVPSLKQRVLDRLAIHKINVDPQRLVVEEHYTPEAWKNNFGLYDGSAFGAAHTLTQMGPMRLKNYDPNIKGLFFVGASTTPGTGMPMVVLSGKMTAERVMQYVC